MRESLTSYLHPFSRHDDYDQIQDRDHDHKPESNFDYSYTSPNNPYTPPSSHSPHHLYNITIPSRINSMMAATTTTNTSNITGQQPQQQPNHNQTFSLPLTPDSTLNTSMGYAFGKEGIITNKADGENDDEHQDENEEDQVIPLISALFPYQATSVASLSHSLEIVTPPHHVLEGFILDQPHHGRTVFIHLPPVHPSAPIPYPLTPNFSEILRPHVPPPPPSHSSSSSSSKPNGNTTTSPLALDIRESVTALLDLASESLFAVSLVLVLDKDDRDHEGLAGLLHALMYVGGSLIKPGVFEGGLEWDSRRWVLVGIDL